MYIGLNTLARAKPENVIRLANFMGIVTHNRLIDDVIEEIVQKTNPWNRNKGLWVHE